MIEITAVILLITFILIGRLTKPRQLDRPVVIARGGNYHVTLAPGVNLAITLIEQIARSYRAQPALAGDSVTMFLAVDDPSLKRYAIDTYFLAIALRQGVLYFQAMQAAGNDGNRSRQLGEFAEVVSQSMPGLDAPETQQAERLMAALEQAIVGHDIKIQRLQV